MKTKPQTPAATLEPAKAPAVKIFGVGSAGVTMLDLLNSKDFADAGFVAINTDAPSLAASSAAIKIQLETKLLRGLGTGGGGALDDGSGGAASADRGSAGRKQIVLLKNLFSNLHFQFSKNGRTND